MGQIIELFRCQSLSIFVAMLCKIALKEGLILVYHCTKGWHRIMGLRLL